MLHSDPIMAPLRGWKLRKKKGFFAAEGKGRTIRREGKKLVQDGEQEHFWSHPYLRCDPFSRRSSLSFSFVFLSSCLAGEWLENRLFFNMPKKCCATQRQQTAGVVVGHWSRKRWGIPPRTRCWEPHQDNESSPKFSATLDQRSNRLQPALHHNSNLVHVCQWQGNGESS